MNVGNDKLLDEYSSIAPLAERFAEEISHQLSHLFDDTDISLSFPIQKRVKDWNSIYDKLERKSLSLNSIKDLNDLVGLRVILQFRRDVESVIDIIKKNFEILENYNTIDRLKEDQFGYSSFHFIVKLPEAWLGAPTLSSLKGLKAEIQVRTTAQHIWASASHTLQYKHENSVPLQVRRAIHRVSALLETVDLEFDRVLEQRSIYRDQLDVNKNELLNVDLLEKILDKEFPIESKDSKEPYSFLLEDLFHFNIKNSNELTDLIKLHRDGIRSEDQKEASSRSKTRFFTHVGLARAGLALKFGKSWSEYIIEVSPNRIEGDDESYDDVYEDDQF